MNERQMKLFKRAFMPLTPQAMEAGQTPPVDPNTGMPMDPNMMQGGMPPQGAPMDPNAQGGAPMSTGDQVIDMLMQMGAVIIDGQSGQPIPPEALAQIVAEMTAQGGQQPEGVPQDPQQTDLLQQMMETMAQMDFNITVLRDKIDSIRNIVEERPKVDKEKQSTEDQANQMDAEVAEMLAEQAQQAPVETVPVAPVEMPPPGLDQNQAAQIQLLNAMQQGYPLQ